MKKLYFLIVLLVIVLSDLSATHIVGGSLTYEHLGGSTYRVQLKLYRDCAGINFPGNVSVQVHRGDNDANIFDINMPFQGATTLDPFIDTCAFNPGVCVQEAIYSEVVNNLPPGTGGYHLWWSTCCWNNANTNIVINSGSAYYTYIPENNQWLTNSSPEWVNSPPTFVCLNQPLAFDHSATDKDGDSLAYSLYHPWTNSGLTFSNPFYTFNQVTYELNYHHLSPMENTTAQTMWIDAVTGLLTTVPQELGQFVVGVQMEEWRDGTLLNIVYRDFQFNVLNCPPPVAAQIGPVDGCNGDTIQFTDASSGAQGWFWDFGDLSTTTDTSSQQNPTYIYPDTGTYTVMLIIQPGTPCADTTFMDVTVSYSIAGFTANPDSVCVGTPVNFNDTSISANNGTINSWFWDFGDSNTSTIPNPSHTWATGGTYSVMLVVGNTVGCFDTVFQDIYVQDMPTAFAGNDTVACTNDPTVTLSGFVTGATGGTWVGGNGTYTPNNSTLNADYTPTIAEITAGSVTLILTSTGNGLCGPATDTITISYVPGPDVQAGNDISVCSDTSGVPLSGTVTIATGGTWSTAGDGIFTPDPDSLNVTYVPGTNDTANGSVEIYLTSTGNGNCLPQTDTILITFFDPPTVAIAFPDTSCQGYEIPVVASSSTGTGTWSTLGSGSFAFSDTTSNNIYQPSSNDDSTGVIILVYTSTNNGGCQPVSDTITIQLIPSPIATFSHSEVCQGDSTTFIDQSNSVEAIINWTWDFGDSNSSNAQNPSHLYDTAGVYTVLLTIESENGCIDTISQQVIVNHLPQADFYVDNLCENVPTEFYDSSSVVNATINSWSWDFGDGGTDTTQNPIHDYATSGTYFVTLIVTSDQGCVDTITKPIESLPLPTADFTLSEEAVNVFQDVDFTDQSSGGPIQWEWDFGDSTGTSMEQNPTYDYQQPGTYTITLIITDANGCTDTIRKEIVIFLPPLVPSAFSPNGDGENDILYVKGGPYTDLDFRVYNNWGELIFVSNNQSDGWNGKRENIDQAIGVYVYTVVATTEDGVVHKLNGDVTLLR